MNEFIHTFSLKTYITQTEKTSLQNAYGDTFFFNSSQKHYVLSYYAEEGFRLEIAYNSKAERRFNKEHPAYKAELVVTPGKLLYPGKPMAKLTEELELCKAAKRLYEIFEDIFKQSGVRLADKLKAARVDVAKDVEMPSESYVRALIILSKRVLHRKGYRIWLPEEGISEEPDWKEENATFFYNHNQEVKAKLYNKTADLALKGHRFHSPIVRFELSLMRIALKRLGWIDGDFIDENALFRLLCAVQNSAAILLDTHIVQPMQDGGMLTKKLQRKYIRKQCGGKNKQYKTMLAYRDWCNAACHTPVFENIKKQRRAEEYFRKMGLSPYYLDKELLYIPSFAELLSGTYNSELLRFVGSCAEKR